MSGDDVSALVSTRICHDLVNPIGAISNGVELLSMMAAAHGAELGLIQDSVNSAAQKLRCLRLAFGNAVPGATVMRAEIAQAVAALSAGRLSVTLEPGADQVPRVTAKAMMLTLMCQERVMPLGGACHAWLVANGFALETTAERVRPAPELWRLVEGGAPAQPLDPVDVQFAVLGQLLARHRASLIHEAPPGGLRLSVQGLAV